MIRVTMEIIPKGDWNKKFTAGILDIENDQTGDVKLGNYDLHLTGPTDEGDGVMSPNNFWDKGRLTNFYRSFGWWECVKQSLEKFNLRYDIPHKD